MRAAELDQQLAHSNFGPDVRRSGLTSEFDVSQTVRKGTLVTPTHSSLFCEVRCCILQYNLIKHNQL